MTPIASKSNGVCIGIKRWMKKTNSTDLYGVLYLHTQLLTFTKSLYMYLKLFFMSQLSSGKCATAGAQRRKERRPRPRNDKAPQRPRQSPGPGRRAARAPPRRPSPVARSPSRHRPVHAILDTDYPLFILRNNIVQLLSVTVHTKVRLN